MITTVKLTYMRTHIYFRLITIFVLNVLMYLNYLGRWYALLCPLEAFYNFDCHRSNTFQTDSVIWHIMLF